LAILTAAVGAGAWWWEATPGTDARAGQAIFQGQAGAAAPPIGARLVGHTLQLPEVAWRCGNCHELSAGSRYARPLDRQALTTPQPRRGGPPTRYDARSLCALLRTGVDPAQVMIDTTMPRYELSDGQCQQLWQYLQSR
jgi:hypothetical protein